MKKRSLLMESDICKLFLVKINDTFDSELYDALSCFVTPNKEQELDNTKSDIVKKLRLYAEILTRIAICQDLNVENKDIEFERTCYGKPYLLNDQDYHFSVSHTRNMIAVAVSNKSVGVDVEKVREVDLRIAKRFYTPQERNHLASSLDVKYERFFEIWTKKEAYIKYIGKESSPLNSLNVMDKELSEHFHTLRCGEYIASVFYEEKNAVPTTILMPERGLVELARDLISFTNIPPNTH